MTAFVMKPLGELVDFLDHMRRPVKSNERREGPYPYYGANGQQGTIDGYLFDEPLVLLAEDGGHFDNPGRGIAYRVDGKVWVNNHAHVLRARDGVDLDYVCRVLEHRDVTRFLTGSTRAKLTKGGAARIPIPLPPFTEQKRIAAVLDEVDALRAKRRQAIALLDQLTQAIFVDMFGDPLLASHHPRRRLAEVSTIQTGPFGSLLHKEDYIRGGISLVNPMHIIDGDIIVGQEHSVTDSKAAELHSFRLLPGDVVLARRGEMGRCAVVREDHGDLLCGTGSLIIRPALETISAEFLAAVLSRPSVKRRLEESSLGATLPNLNQNIVGGLTVSVPPLDEQNHFLHRVAAVRAMKQTHRDHLANLDDLFTSLQQRAFSGTLWDHETAT